MLRRCIRRIPTPRHRVLCAAGVALAVLLMFDWLRAAPDVLQAAGVNRPSGDPERIDGVDGVLRMFGDYPIVALGERHGVREEHAFFQQVVKHPRAAGTFQDIVVEFGNARFQSVMDRYVGGEAVPYEQLRQCWRDTTQSPTQSWESPVYEQLFATVRQVNQALPAEQRFRVLLGDPPIDWNIVRTQEALMPFLEQRDAHFAEIVLREVLAKNRRGLLIAGVLHVFKDRDTTPMPNVVTRVLAQRPHSVGVVLPHAGGFDGEEVDARFREWPVPSLARVQDTWLGERVFLDLLTPWGPVLIRWREAADALLWLGPPSGHAQVARNPLAYVGERPYLLELRRRYQLAFGEPFDPDAPVYYSEAHHGGGH